MIKTFIAALFLLLNTGLFAYGCIGSTQKQRNDGFWAPENVENKYLKYILFIHAPNTQAGQITRYTSYICLTDLSLRLEPGLRLHCLSAEKSDTSRRHKYLTPYNHDFFVGYEGFHSSLLEVGVGVNIEVHSTKVVKKHESGFGVLLSGKKDLSAGYWGINVDIAKSGYFFGLGLNYNYNQKDALSNNGIKPYIFIAIGWIGISYGYNFHAQTSISEINSNQITFRFFLPCKPYKVKR